VQVPLVPALVLGKHGQIGYDFESLQHCFTNGGCFVRL